MPKRNPDILGLYIHVPFCSSICHYCDFAKTSRFDESITERFWVHVTRQFESWVRWWRCHFDSRLRLHSVFFGGGTPSLFVRELEDFVSLLRPYLVENAEITIEVNPEHATKDSLSRWRAAGINRLSLGIQSFNDRGLKFLTRAHSAKSAEGAVERSLVFFENVNLDLIFGWPGQNEVSWLEDLSKSVQMKVAHLSIYNLTYEPRTVIGRRYKRGLIETPSAEMEAHLYGQAQDFLAQAGYFQEEVSNWTFGKHTCHHNWLYWSGDSYIALGPGSHGFIDLGEAPYGVRYHYPSSLLSVHSSEMIGDDSQALVSFLESTGAQIEHQRGAQDYLMELVGSQFRTCKGIDLKGLKERTGLQFRPRRSIQQAIEDGFIQWNQEQGRLTLASSEWIREGYWTLECVMSFFVD